MSRGDRHTRLISLALLAAATLAPGAPTLAADPAVAAPAAPPAAPPAQATTAATAGPAGVNSTDDLQEIVVTAQRLGLIGTATTSSQGIVVNDELALTPAYRPGQLLETIPGLVVTSHSGEGKANQYLLRGFNLDHGTDLAVFVDGMPVNEVTHAHGQGYTDLNFLISEMATDIAFTKGPYFANLGDFGSVGSVRIGYLNEIPAQASVTVGTLGFQRLFAGGSQDFGAGSILGALELQHYDGPWVKPDDQRKLNAVLRYDEGDAQHGYSATGMYYHGLWNSTTDQPLRAIREGLISRFGSLDPADGGQGQRASVSGQYHATLGDSLLTANAYAISNHLTLWNDFTHELIDPLNADQEAQHEDRRTFGGSLELTGPSMLLGSRSELSAGLQTRADYIDVSRLPTRDRNSLPAAVNPLGFREYDRVRETNLDAYLQSTTHWAYWLRSTVGLRKDWIHESDQGSNPGAAGRALLQPKASLIVTPVDTMEFYLSAGRGFHSDDARGVNQAALTRQSGAPLVAASAGQEIGMREKFRQNLVAALTFFRITFQSETTYDPDVGQDSAGPASLREGGELNLTFQARRWLEFYGSVAFTHSRFAESYDDGTGHSGKYIPNAPNIIASFAAYVKGLGPWNGGLEYRYLGSEPLTPDNAVRGDGYGEWNGNLRYDFQRGWGIAVGIYNILDVRSNAAEYWYTDRLAGEPTGGVSDVHIHPLEPRSVRLTASRKF